MARLRANTDQPVPQQEHPEEKGKEVAKEEETETKVNYYIKCYSSLICEKL